MNKIVAILLGTGLVLGQNFDPNTGDIIKSTPSNNLSETPKDELNVGKESFLDTYNSNTIYLQTAPFMGAHFIKQNKRNRLGLLKYEMNRFPESKKLYGEYIMMRGFSLVTMVGGPILSAMMMKEGNPGTGSIVYMGSIITSIMAFQSATNKLNKAVWVFNRESISAETSN